MCWTRLQALFSHALVTDHDIAPTRLDLLKQLLASPDEDNEGHRRGHRVIYAQPDERVRPRPSER